MDCLAKSMLVNHGMAVDAFMTQRLDWYLAAIYAEEREQLAFIDEL